MTQEQLRRAVNASARLRHFSSRKEKRLSAMEWYEREELRGQLEEMGVDSPEVPGAEKLPLDTPKPVA